MYFVDRQADGAGFVAHRLHRRQPLQLGVRRRPLQQLLQAIRERTNRRERGVDLIAEDANKPLPRNALLLPERNRNSVIPLRSGALTSSKSTSAIPLRASVESPLAK